jgi:hypothetical protein
MNIAGMNVSTIAVARDMFRPEFDKTALPGFGAPPVETPPADTAPSPVSTPVVPGPLLPGGMPDLGALLASARLQVLAGQLTNAEGLVDLDVLSTMVEQLNILFPSQVPPHEGPVNDIGEALAATGLNEYRVGGARSVDVTGMPVWGPEMMLPFMPSELDAMINFTALNRFSNEKLAFSPEHGIDPASLAMNFAVGHVINQRLNDYLGTQGYAFVYHMIPPGEHEAPNPALNLTPLP